MEILNCEMEYECPQKWDEMIASINPNIRHCYICKKDVHFCHSVEDLDKAINQHQCVAFVSAESIANDKTLRELISNINERKNQTLKQGRTISITTGIPNYRGGKAFLEQGEKD